MQGGETPLFKAAQEGCLDVVSKLLDAGAGVATATNVSTPSLSNTLPVCRVENRRLAA
jgi:ankyrin repeat protein